VREWVANTRKKERKKERNKGRKGKRKECREKVGRDIVRITTT